MIEDMRHLTVLDDLNREIYTLLSHFNARASGKTDKKFLCELRLEELRSLGELVAAHSRAVAHMAGHSVPPMAHEAEAVITGHGGLAS